MIEIFSSDIEYVCKSIQKTLDYSNGFTKLIDDKFSKYIEIARYKYDDGKPFAFLSTRFYSAARIFDFRVIFDKNWYENATESQLQLISNLTLNIKNLELNVPIFMQSHTFDNEVDGADCHTKREFLNVNYNDCVIIGPEKRYHMRKCNVFNNCVFVDN